MLGYGVVTNGSKGLVTSGLKLIHLFLVSPQAVCYGLSNDSLKKKHVCKKTVAKHKELLMLQPPQNEF